MQHKWRHKIFLRFSQKLNFSLDFWKCFCFDKFDRTYWWTNYSQLNVAQNSIITFINLNNLFSEFVRRPCLFGNLKNSLIQSRRNFLINFFNNYGRKHDKESFPRSLSSAVPVIAGIISVLTHTNLYNIKISVLTHTNLALKFAYKQEYSPYIGTHSFVFGQWRLNSALFKKVINV